MGNIFPDSAWLTGEVIHVNRWSDRNFTLKIRAEVEPFIAGQYFKLGLIVEGDRLCRPYSLCSAPRDPFLEFYIAAIQGGKLSPHLGALEVGQPIWVSRRASGRFTLERLLPCRRLWFFSTGTAWGPAYSMLASGIDANLASQIILVHAVRKASERLPLSHALKSLVSGQYTGRMRVVWVVSQEIVPGTLCGRIPDLLASGELERAAGSTLSPYEDQVMLCGQPEMVRVVRNHLVEARDFRKDTFLEKGNVACELYA